MFTFQMRMPMTLDQSLKMRQQILHELVLRMPVGIGALERKILKKVDFDESTGEPSENNPFYEILYALLMRASRKDKSLISQICKSAGIQESHIAKIKVKQFRIADLGEDFGTKRHVAKIELLEKNGQTLTATVSLDRQDFDDEKNSPSLQEAETLKDVDPSKTWSVQRLLGSKILEDEEGKRGVIAKEFVPGEMLSAYGFLPEAGLSPEPGSPVLAEISKAVGRAVKNALDSLSGIPTDSNPFNFIINEDQTNGIHARWCDTERLVQDDVRIDREISLIRQNLAPYAVDFDNGLKSTAEQVVLPPLITG